MRNHLLVAALSTITVLGHAEEMVVLLDEFPAFETRVVDSNGEPLKGIGGFLFRRGKFSNMTYFNGVPSSSDELKKTGEDGLLNAPSIESNLRSQPETEFSFNTILALSGEGYAPTVFTLTGTDLPKSVTMDPGVDVTIELVGDTVRGEPRVLPVDYREKGYDSDFIEMKKLEKNIWSVVLKDGETYTVDWMPKGAFLRPKPKFRGYLSEPFEAHDGLHVPISPGEPSTIVFEFPTPPDWMKPYPLSVSLATNQGPNNAPTPFHKRKRQALTHPGKIKFKGLAAGDYSIMMTTPRQAPGMPENHYILDSPFSELRSGAAVQNVTVSSGETKAVVAKFPEYDDTFQPGDVAIRGRVTDVDGNPVSGVVLNVKPWYDTLAADGTQIRPDRIYKPQVSDDDGRFQFAGIDPESAIEWSLIGTLPSGELIVEPVKKSNVEGRDAIDIEMVHQERISFDKNAVLPELKLTDLDGKPVKLEAFRGKTVLVDFWATWCAPCREGMPKFQEAAASQENDDVVFLTVSVDENIEAWPKMLEDKDWMNATPVHFSRKANRLAFGSPIPLYVHIDKDGRIVESGHGFDVVERALGLKLASR